jgi:hypothetical protein
MCLVHMMKYWPVILTNTLYTSPVSTGVFKLKYVEEEWQL